MTVIYRISDAIGISLSKDKAREGWRSSQGRKRGTSEQLCSTKLRKGKASEGTRLNG